MRRRKLTHVAAIGDELIEKMDPRGKRHQSRILALWPHIAGPDVADHTRGFALKGGELLVYVDSPAWANELSIMSEEFRARLNQEAGGEAIQTLRFIVSKRAREGAGE